MIWIIGVLVVGLIVVLGELLLSYQMRAQELRTATLPLHKRIRAHNEAMREAMSKIQGSARGQVDELEEQLQGHTQQLNTFIGTLSGLELQLFGPDYDPKTPRPAKENGEADTEDDGLGGPSEKAEKKEASPEELVHQARDEYEEVQGHRTSLLRDIEIVKRTLGMLESKLRTAPAAAGNKKNK